MISKTTLALEIAEDLRSLASHIEAYAAKVQVSDNRSKLEPVQAEMLKPESIPIEKVRAVLAEKSQSGKQPDVKALITKYGAKKLTDIDHVNYPEILREAEAL